MPTPLPARKPVWDTLSAPHRLALGLRALSPGDPWLELDEDLAVDLLEKERLLRSRRDDVFVELPESRDAQRQVLELVVGELLARHPDLYARHGNNLRIEATHRELDLADPSTPPLETAARLVQEDLVVMEATSEGWCLTAAAVCFPSRWPLRPQLGRPMTQIHERVPGYREQLDTSANRFFDGMKHGLVFARGNWSLMDDPALFQPTGKMRSEANPDLDRDNAGDEIWLRVEHQTLQRLVAGDAILFSIRIHRTPLRDVARNPAAARTLVDAIATMAPDMQRYKSLGMVREAALAYLETALQRALASAPDSQPESAL